MEYLIVVPIIFCSLATTTIVALFGNAATSRVFAKHPWAIGVVCVGFFGLIVVLSMQLGMIATGESSAFPWVVWSEELSKHGYPSAIFGAIASSMFLLWVFFIPAQYFTRRMKPRNEKSKPVYLYIINIAFGLMLITPDGPIFGLVEGLRDITHSLDGL